MAGSWGTTARAMLDRNAYAKSSAVGVAGRCMARCFAHRSQADIKRSQYARGTRVSLARPIWSMMRPLRGMRRSMKKAIGDNMIPKEWGFEKGLELVKQAGFDGIELWRSEEHTSELQSLTNLVCRLLLEKKKTNKNRLGAKE